MLPSISVDGDVVVMVVVVVVGRGAKDLNLGVTLADSRNLA